MVYLNIFILAQKKVTLFKPNDSDPYQYLMEAHDPRDPWFIPLKRAYD
jgi:hypothetical protein